MAVKDVNMDRRGDGIVIVTWEGLDDGDSGTPVQMPHFPDRTVQVIGNATSVAIEGSNDGTNFVALTGPDGAAIALAGATSDMTLIVENPRYIRPVATGGSSTDVILIGHTER